MPSNSLTLLSLNSHISQWRLEKWDGFLDMIRGNTPDSTETEDLSTAAKEAKLAKKDGGMEPLPNIEGSWEWIEERPLCPNTSRGVTL
jgi:hypothetical protein